MLMRDVYFEREPQAIVIMPLPNGMADVWLRRGIAMAAKEGEADLEGTGGLFTVREEAYARLTADEVNEDTIAQGFEDWFMRVARWEPPAKGDKATEEAEALWAVRKQVEQLTDKVNALNGQNEALVECLLEMSGMVYG